MSDLQAPNPLTRYDAARRALAEVHRFDELKNLRDKAVAMQAYAKQAKDTALITHATEIRMRAERRAGELLREMAERKERDTGKGNRNPALKSQAATPKLADLGVSKSQSSRWQQLAALDQDRFEAKVGTASKHAYDRMTQKVLRESKIERAKALSNEQPLDKNNLITLVTHTGRQVEYPLPKGKATFNRTNQQVDWAAHTWNPVTGCLHGCRYCYAREMAEMRETYRAAYPVGFTPLFHHERLDAPANTEVPKEARCDPRLKRVFVCSMADLYGKWVPTEWIEKVHASCIANPQWDYLFLTKFPKRYTELQLPSTAWIGTSIDQQSRVKYAEEAFRNTKGVRVKWLSLEPLLAPLQFSDLSMFDWIVIGSQSATVQPDGPVKEFAPPFEWVARIVAQARDGGCKVYLKPNLLGGNPNPQSPGMQLPQEDPEEEIADAAARARREGRAS
jgi:protein gp37